VVSYFFLGAFIVLPFIKMNGNPFFLVNILERKFIFFGAIFWPQDFYLVVMAGLILIVFVILFTAVYGRVFCGWACPQTLLMEMVFRKVEYLIEGDFRKQQKLDQALWNTEKIVKKGTKQLIFILISLFMGHLVMAYLIGVDGVLELVSSSPLDHIWGFLGLVAFSGTFYLVFAKVREIVCTVICPYGRLQGVLLNRESMVVAYDNIRGEPRGKIKKTEPRSNLGDCVDCELCVQVCPTGIDIRNGTQMECINCTACIDSCNEVMKKVNRPKGLIRFDSLEGIENKEGFKFSTRILAYTLVLVFLSGIFGFLMTQREDVESLVLRVPGQLYQKNDDGTISNLYNIQLVNKTFDSKNIELKLKTRFPGAKMEMVGGENMKLPPQESLGGVFFVKIPFDELKTMKSNIIIEVYSNGEMISHESSTFISPFK
jgi:cytochrome c oxidase accessory protein FixG